MPDPELRRLHTFIYDADFQYLQHTFGTGWSAQVREIVRQWVVRDKYCKVESFTTSLSQRNWRKPNFGEG